MRKFLIVAVVVMALAGCKREGPTDDNSVNLIGDNAYENIMPDESMPVDETVNTATVNIVEAPAPPPSIDEQLQTQEDADATGMTARTDREALAEDSSTNSGDAVPVERK